MKIKLVLSIIIMGLCSGVWAQEQAPYNSYPLVVPGVIQAEDFDNGGPKVSYLDTTPGNSGGQYRNTDVDIQSTSDLGGGYNVGWIRAGEWLEYTVNVSVSGRYNLSVRVASPGPGRRLEFLVDGQPWSDALEAPDTGGWQSWADLEKKGLHLSKGLHVIRIVFHAGMNINHFSIKSARDPFHGTPLPVPGIIQAEDFDHGGEGVSYSDTTAENHGKVYRDTGVDIYRTSDIGKSHGLAWTKQGEWLEYTVNVESGGQFDLTARVSTSKTSRRIEFLLDGQTWSGPLDIPKTGSRDSYVDVKKAKLLLTKGVHVIRLRFLTSEVNFNYFTLTPVINVPPPQIQQVLVLNGAAGGSALILRDGDELKSGDFPQGLNIEARVANASRVDFTLSGAQERQSIDHQSPFRVFPSPVSLVPGRYTLMITPHSLNVSGASQVINFSVLRTYDYVVNTLSEALAIQGLENGQKVFVKGYFESGDGGGGIFEARNSNAVPARAFVYVPNNARSPVRIFQKNLTGLNDLYNVDLPLTTNQHLVPDTVSLNISGTGGDNSLWSTSITDDHFHGAVVNSLSGVNSRGHMINYENGQFRPSSFFSGYFGGRLLFNPSTLKGWLKLSGHTASWKYQETVSPIRLHRISDEHENPLPESNAKWSIRWWGLKSHTKSSYYDNSFALGWATKQAQLANKARREQNAQRAVDTLSIRNDRDAQGQILPTDFYSWGSILFPIEVSFEGEAGVVVRTEVDEYGNSFKFARRKSNATRIIALPPQEMEYGYGHTEGLRAKALLGSNRYGPPTKKYLLNSYINNGTPEGQRRDEVATYRATRIKDIILHGNGEAHYPLIASMNLTNEEWEENFRNAPTHTGINGDYQGYNTGSSNNPHDMIPIGRMVLEGVAVTDYMATGVLLHRGAQMVIRNGALFGNSIFNHSFYVYAAVKADVLTIEGYAWTHGTPGGAQEIDWLARIDDRPNLSGRTGQLWGYRGPDDFDFESSEDSQTVHRLTVDVSGELSRDLIPTPDNFNSPPMVHIKNIYNNSDNNVSFTGRGPNVLIENLVRVGKREGLLLHNDNGYGKSSYRAVAVKNTKVFIKGSTSPSNLVTWKGEGLLIDGFEAFSMDAEASSSTHAGALFQVPNNGHSVAGAPRETVIKNFGTPMNPYRALHLSAFLNPKGEGVRRLYLSNVHINNSDKFTQMGGNGRVLNDNLSRKGDTPERHRTGIYAENSSFRIFPGYSSDHGLTYAFSRFRNCIDLTTGRKTEDSLSFTASQGQVMFESNTNLVAMPVFPYEFTKITIADVQKSVGPWGSGAEVEVRYLKQNGEVMSDDRGFILKPESELTSQDLTNSLADRTKPRIELRFRNSLEAGTQVRIDMAVSPWERDVVLPTPIAPRFPSWLFPWSANESLPSWALHN